MESTSFASTCSKIVKGHRRVLHILEKLIRQGRLAHAYMFIGPGGVGKRLIALSLAKALNCSRRKGDFCDACPSCRKIQKGIHPDVKLISPEKGEIRIGEMRVLINDTNYKPLEARMRVFIIDDAHTLNMAASNAFLKTLEEPPEDTLIILITSSPEILPETVISRCEKIYFGPLSQRDILEIMNSQEPDYGRDENIARMAEGSVKKAMEIAREDIYDMRRDLKHILVTLNRNLADLLDYAERANRDDTVFYNFLDMARLIVRDLILIKSELGTDYITNMDIYPQLSRPARMMTLRELIDIIDFVNHIYRAATWRNVNRQLALEMLGLALWKTLS